MAMHKSIEDYDSVLPIITEPELSIDRLTMLIYSPGFSCYEADVNYRDSMGVSTRDKISAFHKAIENIFSVSKIEMEKIQYSLETKLYQYHYRIEDIDIQFCTKLPKTKRIDDEGYIEVWGDDDNIQKGYMYEYYSNDYNIRIEYNPNKADITKVSAVLSWIGKGFYRKFTTSKFIKISRIDFAFDYPEPLNPCLFNFKLSRKWNSTGSSKNGIETVYFGAQKSKFHLCIYNKKEEYDKKQNILYTGAYLWRVELRCHHTWFIHELPEIGLRVLPRIEIFNSGLLDSDWQYNLLLENAVHWGIKSSLAKMPRSTRDRYLQKYRNSSCPIVHPGDLYLDNFRELWEPEKAKILETFGFEANEFCSSAIRDSKL
jgi:hypothetical protein